MIGGPKASLHGPVSSHEPREADPVRHALFCRNARVYWIVFYTGLVMLLPWNILITVNGYWDYKFRNTTLDGVELEVLELFNVGLQNN